MELKDLISQIKNYKPFNKQEVEDKEFILSFLNNNNDAFLRSNEKAHMTASSWIINKSHTKVLMIYHNIYKSWAWTGGHADGEIDLLKVAIKEAQEETGIKDFKVIYPGIFSMEKLDVNEHIKKGKLVPFHYHLNLTYLLEADDETDLKIKEDENSAVAWFDLDAAIEASNEEYFKENIYPKLNAKLKQLK